MKSTPLHSAFYQKLGENIRNFRKRSDLSQEALAKLIGLTRTSMTNIENGRQHPPLHTLCEISEKLKIDVSELLPRAITTAVAVDITAMVGNQLRGVEELAFIKSGIGLNEGGSNGDTKT